MMSVFGLGILLRLVDDRGGSDAGSPEQIAVGVRAKLADHPRQAALAARSIERFDPSPEAELAVIDVAVDGRGRDLVLDTGSPEVTSAAVLERNVVTAGSDRAVQVWSRADGTLLGETQAPAPLAAIAADDSGTSFLAAVDRRGAVGLIDTTDPSRPRFRPLGPALSSRGRPLAVAFASEPMEVVAVSSDGELLRVDATTGELRSRSSLAELRGLLPWTRSASRLSLDLARFVPESYEDAEGLLVATANGAVADLDLGRGQGKTVLEPGAAPGRILSVDRVLYAEPALAVGTTEGLVESNESGYGPPLLTLPGPAVTAVALDFEGSGLWSGGGGGVQFPDQRLPSGPPVTRFDRSSYGIAAIHPGGVASILASPGTGISMGETESTPVATFDPDGRLLIAEGYDANHVEAIKAIRPQARLPEDEYQEEDLLQTYRPDPGWWPEVEDDGALYLNEVAADDEYVVAGGQGPDGDAAVMVWDADSGKPLHHMELGVGGTSDAPPSIVTRVMLLPGKEEIAAYSLAQGLVAIWSTKTWELKDAIPLGVVGDVVASPDESTIVAVGVPEDGEMFVNPSDSIELDFIDVNDVRLDHEVHLDGIVGVSVSPDGSVLALADESGFIRLRTADGREKVGRPILIGSTVETLAWRPDNELLAASLRSGGVVLVDPDTGKVSEPLPSEAYSPGLSWNPEGSLLAAQTAESEDGEHFDPGPTAIWTLGKDEMERRMCELAGCRPRNRPGSSGLGDSSDLSAIDLVYQQGGELMAADVDGHAARIGYLGKYSVPPPAYAWSENGFAWFSPSQVSVLTPGAEKPRSWFCFCSGIAWDGGEVISVASDGSALIHIDPRDGSLRRTGVGGLPPHSPTLLGIVGGHPVVSAFASEPNRATPSTLYELRGGVATQLLADAHGSVYRHWPTNSPDSLAFVVGAAGGICYSTANVGIVSKRPSGGLGVSFPPSPLGDEPTSVQSTQVTANGSVSAAIGAIGCDDSGMPENNEPLSTRYLLNGERWERTGSEGTDVQATREGLAVVEPSREQGVPGSLALHSDGERRVLSPEAEGLVARP